MKPGTAVRYACAILIVFAATVTVVSAHDVFYAGTVQVVSTDSLQVRVVDAATKKEEAMTFGLTKDTKVRRGDRTVTMVEAAIAAGERVVVVVDHDAPTTNVATEVRLAAK